MNPTKKATAVEKGKSLRRMVDALTSSLAGGEGMKVSLQ